MQPTVGRVVHYHPHPTQARNAGLPPQLLGDPHAALITYVHDEKDDPAEKDWVELVVFAPRGSTYTVSASEGDGAGEWSWPPRA